MNVLVVSTVDAFPVRDGVTIPLSNYVRLFNQIGSVHFLLLRDIRRTGDLEFNSATEAECSAYYSVAIKRVSPIRGVAEEVFISAPYYGSWYPVERLPKEVQEIHFDVLWFGTPAAAAIWMRNGFGNSVSFSKSVAAISDFPSLVEFKLHNSSSFTGAQPSRLIRTMVARLRDRLLSKADFRLYSQFSKTLVQSDAEVEWARGRSNLVPSSRDLDIRAIPNGVDSNLFRIELERSSRHSLLFVGALHGVYGKRVEWLLDSVWQELKEADSRYQFTVVGKGAAPNLLFKMARLGVKHVEFVPRIEDVYKNSSILVAPIFKGFGVINKVIESMAAGVVVVGDRTAFNGIPGFENNLHGVVAEEGEFLTCIQQLVSSEDSLDLIRERAREHALQNFSWETRFEDLLAWLGVNRR